MNERGRNNKPAPQLDMSNACTDSAESASHNRTTRSARSFVARMSHLVRRTRFWAHMNRYFGTLAHHHLRLRGGFIRDRARAPKRRSARWGKCPSRRSLFRNRVGRISCDGGDQLGHRRRSAPALTGRERGMCPPSRLRRHHWYPESVRPPAAYPRSSRSPHPASDQE